MAKDEFKIGESIEILYTIYREEETVRDLTDAETLEVYATLFNVRGERKTPIQKFSSSVTSEGILPITVDSQGLTIAVIHPLLSKQLNEGNYIVEYGIKLDKSSNIAYPDGYSITDFNKSYVEFKMIK